MDPQDQADLYEAASHALLGAAAARRAPGGHATAQADQLVDVAQQLVDMTTGQAVGMGAAVPPPHPTPPHQPPPAPPTPTRPVRPGRR